MTAFVFFLQAKFSGCAFAHWVKEDWVVAMTMLTPWLKKNFPQPLTLPNEG
jgi:hypothetical protein